MNVDSLEKILPGLVPGVHKISILFALSYHYYGEEFYAEAIDYSQEAISMAEKINTDSLYIRALNLLTRSQLQLGMYTEANQSLKKIDLFLEKNKDYTQLGRVYSELTLLYFIPDGERATYFYRALDAYEKANDTSGIASSYSGLGVLNTHLKNFAEAGKQLTTALTYYIAVGDSSGIRISHQRLAMFYRFTNQFKKALEMDSTALAYASIEQDTFGIAWIMASIGRSLSLYASYVDPSNPDRKQLQQALDNVIKAENYFIQLRYPEMEYPRLKMMALQGMVLSKLKKWQEAKTILKKCETLSRHVGNDETLKDAHQYMVSVDSAVGNYKEALYHLREYDRLQDLAITTEDVRQSTSSRLKYETDKTMLQIELENSKQEAANKRTRLLMLGGILIFLLTTLFFFINNRQKQKSKKQIETAYAELKNTQSQLIHAEKMASLGELTAGIAHEIQNPLNFVNNFSEVNAELVDELQHELATLRPSSGQEGNVQLANEIAGNIKDNEEKIVFHGKRADAIVKSMLQHSRVSAGKKELTDINALADEYLRLAYHGMRAKDSSFNVELKTSFDPAVEKINIVGQDIGRVFLNILTNAFHAVAEKSKSGVPGYQPVVSVTTKKNAGNPEIEISDNGTGMPQGVVDKIFQPFFTTKSVGQGTGLGLSISYDIVKAHGGELKVETKEGKGTTFSIHLPN